VRKSCWSYTNRFFKISKENIKHSQSVSYTLLLVNNAVYVYNKFWLVDFFNTILVSEVFFFSLSSQHHYAYGAVHVLSWELVEFSHVLVFSLACERESGFALAIMCVSTGKG